MDSQITRLEQKDTVHGVGPVDGETKGNSSTRAELFAIASSLIFFTELIKFHKLDTTSSLCIWSNSVAAIH